MTIQEALDHYERSQEALSDTLRGLSGVERREGLKLAHKRGIGATELALILGLSRQRVYELLE